MNDYIHGNILGLASILLAGHVPKVIAVCFVLISYTNLLLTITYAVRYVRNIRKDNNEEL